MRKLVHAALVALLSGAPGCGDDDDRPGRAPFGATNPIFLAR